MTAINALVRSDRVHFWTDGAVWEPDGRIVGAMEKVCIFEDAHAALSARGPTRFLAFLWAILRNRDLKSFDALIAELPRASAEAALIAGRQPSDIVVAGWSHARGRGEIWNGSTTRPGWRMENAGDGFIMPGENPELIARLHRAGWSLEDESRDEASLLELMELQRTTDDILPNGARFPTVGGFAQHTLITADGISTRIVRRWSTDLAA